jgi:hypothetical protein
VTIGGASSRWPQSGVSKTPSYEEMPLATTSSRHRAWPMMVAGWVRELPWVWSPWWWVLTRTRRGAGDTSATAARNARVRRSVAQVSMATTPSSATTKPVLLIHQVPSGWM